MGKLVDTATNHETPCGSSDFPIRPNELFVWLITININGGSNSVCLPSRHANPLWPRAFFFLLRSSSGRFRPVWENRFGSVWSRIFWRRRRPRARTPRLLFPLEPSHQFIVRLWCDAHAFQGNLKMLVRERVGLWRCD